MRFGTLIAIGAVLCAASGIVIADNSTTDTRMWSDPVTRYIHVKYDVPSDAPESVEVACSWSPSGKNEWRPARVTPLISETGLSLASDADIERWSSGRLTERRAAGLTRTVVFDPYPDAQLNGRVDADFRIVVSSPEGDRLLSEIIPLAADNTDVTYITDWSKVLQKDAVAKTPTGGRWLWSDDSLRAEAGKQLPTLTYPLSMKGSYAIFAATDPNAGCISLGLTGDERSEKIASTTTENEIFWRWTKIDHQNILIKQWFTAQGSSDAGLKYIKLVPLSDSLESSLNAQFSGKRDKFLAAYFEPFSYTFNTDIMDGERHREPISAYADAGIDLVDIQIARIGVKAVCETKTSDQHLYSTMSGKATVADGVWRMQPNALETELKHAKSMGLRANVNFGAGNCYQGSPLSSDFSEKHPDWRLDSALKREIPDIEAYVLKLFREALEIGAPGISIDFCRYPECVDSKEVCTGFIRSLRRLADEFGRDQHRRVPILVEFPADGAGSKFFDYRTWAREGLVDYLCPGNITGVYQLFDVKPYVAAAKGTKCKVAPVIDAIAWGPVMPGGFLGRVKSIYDAGADGVYVYQADDPIVYNPSNRRYVTIAGSSEAVNRWLKLDAKQLPHRSKGIFITKPFDGKAYSYYERVRIHVEGVKPGKVETYIDGNLVGKFTAPPYILGTDGDESNKVIPNGIHTLTVRAEDGKGWIEQRFIIEGRE
jgi:hypothetical protein